MRHVLLEQPRQTTFWCHLLSHATQQHWIQSQTVTASQEDHQFPLLCPVFFRCAYLPQSLQIPAAAVKWLDQIAVRVTCGACNRDLYGQPSGSINPTDPHLYASAYPLHQCSCCSAEDTTNIASLQRARELIAFAHFMFWWGASVLLER